jgi:small subunit ribosomal protein S21
MSATTTVNAAIRVLKKKMQREGTFREMKRRRSYKSHRSDECAKGPRRAADTARRWASGSSARVTDEGSAESCGKPWIEKRREAAAQNRQGRARLDALQVAGSLLILAGADPAIRQSDFHPGAE